MSNKPEQQGAETDFREICFGLNRQTDEQSLAIFLRLFNQEQLLETLIPRLSDGEIMELVDQLSGLLRSHLREKEYHELFLGDFEHHH
jgi:TorA maturation chaperone TorD